MFCNGNHQISNCFFDIGGNHLRDFAVLQVTFSTPNMWCVYIPIVYTQFSALYVDYIYVKGGRHIGHERGTYHICFQKMRLKVLFSNGRSCLLDNVLNLQIIIFNQEPLPFTSNISHLYKEHYNIKGSFKTIFKTIFG